MDPITFEEFKKRAIHSVKVHKMLCDGSFWKNKLLVEELMDESPLEEDCYMKNKIRLGSRYQAIIPKLKN